VNYNSPKDYILQLLQDLDKEKQAEREAYEEERSKTTLKEKKALGIVWYPVEIEIEAYPILTKTLLKVTKKPDSFLSEFQTGNTVFFFSMENSQERSFGTIVSVTTHQARVLLSEDLPEWMEETQIGMEKYYDESTYQEMERALNILLNPQNPITQKLLSICTGFKQPSFSKFVPKSLPNLNESQIEAWKNLLSAVELGIIHGPPGTGKTKTLIEVAKFLSNQNSRVLLTAASNVAVDVLTEKALEEGLELTRIGNLARVSQKILEHTLDFQIQNHPNYKFILKLKKEAEILFREAEKFKRNFGTKQREERKVKRKEAREILQHVAREETQLIDQILQSKKIITSTIMGLTNNFLHKEEFQTIIVDEATQCLEPLIWIAILKTKGRIFLAGDHFQLPPTTHLKNSPFLETLFEKLIKKFPDPPITNFLDIQYRMHPNIVKFSNQEFYESKLQTSSLILNKTLSQDFSFLCSSKAILFIDTAGGDFLEEWEESTKSYWNLGELELILNLLENYKIKNFPSHMELGILSPYREQVERLKKQIQKLFPASFSNLDIDVNTVDSFQGSQKDMIWISLVRSNEKREIGFLTDIRRMNVAMTRARLELVIIGDSSTISHHPFYSKLLEFIQEEGTYQSIWEYIY